METFPLLVGSFRDHELLGYLTFAVLVLIVAAGAVSPARRSTDRARPTSTPPPPSHRYGDGGGVSRAAADGTTRPALRAYAGSRLRTGLLPAPQLMTRTTEGNRFRE
jgi:hypothetical protein